VFVDDAVNDFKEPNEFLRTMTRLALAGDEASSGEQRRSAVVLVVVCHGRRAALLQRQGRLRAVERQDLALLVDAQHQRSIRRVQVEANDDIGHLCKHSVSTAGGTAMRASTSEPRLGINVVEALRSRSACGSPPPVPVMFSPSLRSGPPQHGHADGEGCTRRSRGRCSGSGAPRWFALLLGLGLVRLGRGGRCGDLGRGLLLGPPRHQLTELQIQLIK
jgi:hypothetical protein